MAFPGVCTVLFVGSVIFFVCLTDAVTVASLESRLLLFDFELKGLFFGGGGGIYGVFFSGL